MEIKQIENLTVREVTLAGQLSNGMQRPTRRDRGRQLAGHGNVNMTLTNAIDRGLAKWAESATGFDKERARRV